MKIHLVCLLLLCNHCMYGQGELPKNVNANKSLLTIGHYLPGTCGFVNSNSSYRNGHNDNNLMQVLDSLGAYDLGSGFVYRIKNVSYVITCEHVILGSDSIVAYDSAYKPYPLELVGGDSFYDVSVLKFKNAKDNERWEGIAFDYTPQKNTEVYATGFWKWEGHRYK